MNDTIVSGTIYGLHAGDGVIRYIGYTTLTPKQRLGRHLLPSRLVGSSHKVRWILANGRESIKIVVIEYYTDIPLQDLKQREISCIAEARQSGADLVNGTDGGEGTMGYVMPVERRKAIGASKVGNTYNLGKKRTEEQRKRMSEAQKGTKRSEAHTEILRNNFLGKTHTKETRQLLSEINLGNKNALGVVRSEETRQKMSDSQKGKPNRGRHTRWCVNAEKPIPNCVFC